MTPPMSYLKRLLIMLLIVFPLMIVAIAAFSFDPQEVGSLWRRITTVAVLLSFYGTLVAIVVSLTHTYIVRRLNHPRPGVATLLGALLGLASASPLLLTLNPPARGPALIYGASAGALYALFVALAERHRN